MWLVDIEAVQSRQKEVDVKNYSSFISQTQGCPEIIGSHCSNYFCFEWMLVMFV